MRVLVVHQNFPGQFGHFVKAWAKRPGWNVRGLGRETAPGIPGFDGLLRYTLAREGRPNQHPYLRQMEAATLHGQAAARAMLRLRQSGFTPDAILAHPGWGETLYAKDVFPNARLIHYCEWYYSPVGADVGFDPEFPVSFDDQTRIRTWNALHALNLTNCDVGVTPTRWQYSRYPESLRSKLVIQHEGVSPEGLDRDPTAHIKLPSGTVLRAGDPVITYVARNLEPYRGFHIFMRALERIQKVNKKCHAIIIGGHGTSYGKRPLGASNWRDYMLKEVTLDPTRTHFLGWVSRADYINALKISASHVYLTYPFVLSWSLLEAFISDASIVASNTAPVREVWEGNQSDLVDFFDVQRICDGVVESLRTRGLRQLDACRVRTFQQRFCQTLAIAHYEQFLIGEAVSEIQRLPVHTPKNAAASCHKSMNEQNSGVLKWAS